MQKDDSYKKAESWKGSLPPVGMGRNPGARRLFCVIERASSSACDAETSYYRENLSISRRPLDFTMMRY